MAKRLQIPFEKTERLFYEARVMGWYLMASSAGGFVCFDSFELYGCLNTVALT